eukprot:1993505-Rhodomonas_salina.1
MRHAATVAKLLASSERLLHSFGFKVPSSYSQTPRNQIQKTACSAQPVPEMRFLVFEFAVQGEASMRCPVLA